ncbi:DUF5320 domain-containing protein [Candidatus Bathyarchaeota archaeon]|nr:DUF5320 domain-containing protein [Candidatus Bathyarchaeota archaeon]MBS7631635.1 DUF5320 domain-containing protein [Candidatus Bathyarchaeota archaeon]
MCRGYESHGGCGGRYPEGYSCMRHGRSLHYFPPLISVEEEVKALEEIKETLEKRLEIVNARLQKLKA